MTQSESVVVARPNAPRSLILLFHGVGSTAEDLVPLGQYIHASCVEAMVVSVAGTYPSPNGLGREWFPVSGITEASRPQRVREAMPAFLAEIQRWQQHTGFDAERTCLIGFSQGAIMAVESTQSQVLAHRVISVSGRLAEAARHPARPVRFSFIHGNLDNVIAPSYSVKAAEQLLSLGADAQVDLVIGLSHGVDARAARLIVSALQ